MTFSKIKKLILLTSIISVMAVFFPIYTQAEDFLANENLKKEAKRTWLYAKNVFSEAEEIVSAGLNKTKENVQKSKKLVAESVIGSGIVLSEKKKELLFANISVNQNILEQTAINTYRFFNKLFIFDFNKNEVTIV